MKIYSAERGWHTITENRTTIEPISRKSLESVGEAISQLEDLINYVDDGIQNVQDRIQELYDNQNFRDAERLKRVVESNITELKDQYSDNSEEFLIEFVQFLSGLEGVDDSY